MKKKRRYGSTGGGLKLQPPTIGHLAPLVGTADWFQAQLNTLNLRLQSVVDEVTWMNEHLAALSEIMQDAAETMRRTRQKQEAPKKKRKARRKPR